MKILLIIISIIGMPKMLHSQFEYGWRVYGNDSLRVEKFHEKGKIKSVGTYTNNQIKYIRYSRDFKILDTVSYFSPNESLISKVNYEYQTYLIFDSSHKRNFSFIDTCIKTVKGQLENSFGDSFIHDHIFIDPNHSTQYAYDNKTDIKFHSIIYEPNNFQINRCRIVVCSQSNEHARQKYFSEFVLDSMFNIIQSNLNLNKKYILNYNYEYAENIKSKYGWESRFNPNQRKGILIKGPFLDIKSKEINWIIQRTTATLFTGNDWYDAVKNNYVEMISEMGDFIEEIIINTESGETKKTLKYRGIPSH